MRQYLFTEEQIIAVLNEHKRRMATAAVCRKSEIGAASLQRKSKLGEMDVPEARRLKSPQNAKLKRLLELAYGHSGPLWFSIGPIGKQRKQPRTPSNILFSIRTLHFRYRYGDTNI